jgi:hypothetical protein
MRTAFYLDVTAVVGGLLLMWTGLTHLPPYVAVTSEQPPCGWQVGQASPHQQEAPNDSSDVEIKSGTHSYSGKSGLCTALILARYRVLREGVSPWPERKKPRGTRPEVSGPFSLPLLAVGTHNLALPVDDPDRPAQDIVVQLDRLR